MATFLEKSVHVHCVGHTLHIFVAICVFVNLVISQFGLNDRMSF